MNVIPSEVDATHARLYVQMEILDKLSVLSFSTSNEWEKWLALHNDQQDGVWLKLAKKNSGVSSVSYSEALDVALCYGWIDGQLKSYDDSYFLRKFTPRRARSIWSKVNISRLDQLITAGRMQTPGLAAVESAKQDGRWDVAYDSPKNSAVPPDFQAILDEHPQAKIFFATLDRANVYAILWRIQTAKKPEIRQARITKLIAMLEDNKKIHS